MVKSSSRQPLARRLFKIVRLLSGPRSLIGLPATDSAVKKRRLLGLEDFHIFLHIHTIT
jgi:hypothetical protein